MVSVIYCRLDPSAYEEQVQGKMDVIDQVVCKWQHTERPGWMVAASGAQGEGGTAHLAADTANVSGHVRITPPTY